MPTKPLVIKPSPPASSARSAFKWQLELCLLIDEVARIQRTIAGQQMAQFGLTHIQYLALVYVLHHEGMTQTDLQNLLEITRGACTQLVDRLVRSDLLERRPDPHDRRVNRLVLTPAAEQLTGESRAIFDQVHDQMFQDVSQDDAGRVLDFLTLCKQRLVALNGCILED